jgi:hypothetical protein
MTQTLFAALQLEGARGLWAVVWLILVLAGAAFLYWTYRGIFQRSERRLTWWLLLLRGAGLLMLILMLVKPTWTRESEQVEPGRVALIIDNSRSMGLPDESGASRYDRARAAAEKIQKELASSSGARLAVDLYDLTPNRTARPLTELPKEPTVDATDLTTPLRKALKRRRTRPMAAAILISDGADNSGRPDFRNWEDTGVPIHTIGFPRSVKLDLAVREPQEVPRSVLIHNDLSVGVPVAKVGQPALKATVTLRRGGEVLATKEVDLPAGDVEQLVPLTIRPDQPGEFEITAAVEAGVAETDTSNNAVNFRLNVVANPIKVLYLEGFLRYEYKYLKSHLEEDPDVSVVALPRRLSPDAPGGEGARGALTEEQLKNFDVVILGDMEGDYLTGSEYQALLGWLDGKNHSLLVMGGYHSFGPKGFRDKPLAAALPVVFATIENPQSEKPFALELTDKGKLHPIFQVNSDTVQSAKMWKEAVLDGMSLVQKAKSGAYVLAVNAAVQVEGQPAVAVAVQRAGGGGQVMMLCPDTTWKWSRLPRFQGQSDTLYGRFWSQTLRWLAGRAQDDQRPLLTVRTERPIYEANKKVTVRAIRQARPGTDLTGSQIAIEITDPKGKPLPGLVPKVDSADPDMARVEFYPPAAGVYRVSAELKAQNKLLANQNGEFRVQGADLEMSDPTTHPENLQAIKEATGGIYLDIDSAGEVVKHIERIERRTTQAQKTEFWNSPWLFTAFLTLVTGEWFLRRRNHLV